MEIVPVLKDPRIQTFPEHYDSSIPANLLFPEFILNKIAQWGSKIACVDAENKREFKFDEISKNSYALAAGLQAKFNLKPGDRVGIVLPNCLEYPVAVLAVTLCGACAVLFNPAQTIDELKHTIYLTNPCVWIGTQGFMEKFQQLYSDVQNQPPMVVIDADAAYSNQPKIFTLDGVIDYKRTFQRPNVNTSTEAALILFSSGTTGVPKGVVLTHFNLIASRRQSEEMAKSVRRREPQGTQAVVKDPSIIAVLPFFHTFGTTVIFDNLIGGVRCVVMRHFTLHNFLQTIQDFKVSVVAIVPAIAIQLAKQPVEKSYDLSSMKIIRCGASALSTETIKLLIQKFDCTVYQGYGMTEATVRTHATFKNYNKEGSIGVVVPFCQSKVVDRETNEILGPNQEGEICVKGPIVMKGYIGDATATSATIDSDGWLHTGDVGYYDTDGFFFITDRMKELIKYKGYQVSPTELEKILLTHPEVLDVAVAPVAHQSAGEVPRAYVVKRSGSTVSSDELASYLSGKVSSYKWLRGGVVFIHAIPKTSTGKIIRRALKTQPVLSKL